LCPDFALGKCGRPGDKRGDKRGALAIELIVPFEKPPDLSYQSGNIACQRAILIVPWRPGH
jgi:hypothetical protein